MEHMFQYFSANDKVLYCIVTEIFKLAHNASLAGATEVHVQQGPNIMITLIMGNMNFFFKHEKYQVSLINCVRKSYKTH